MALRTGFTSLFILLLSAPLLSAQGASSAQLANQHLLGTWTGVNHDYTVTPVATHQLSIQVQSRKKNGLDMDYFYVDEGEHQDRLVVFQPSTSTVLIDRNKFGKQRLRADGLDEFLRTGYGNLTLWGVVLYQGDHQALERAEYHLSPDSWSYELYVSAHHRPFVKTGDWAMKRATNTP
jgi:hypothetical protein